MNLDKQYNLGVIVWKCSFEDEEDTCDLDDGMGDEMWETESVSNV